MPSNILHVHLIANPLGPVALVVLVPEAFVIRNIGMLPATLVSGAMWAILVDGLGTSTASAITRFATAVAVAATSS